MLQRVSGYANALLAPSGGGADPRRDAAREALRIVFGGSRRLFDDFFARVFGRPLPSTSPAT